MPTAASLRNMELPSGTTNEKSAPFGHTLRYGNSTQKLDAMTKKGTKVVTFLTIFDIIPLNIVA